MLLLSNRIGILLILLPSLSSAPSSEKPTCFFGKQRTSDHEGTKERLGSMKVSTSEKCTDQLTRMNALMWKSPAREHFGTFDLLDLILARGAAHYRTSPSDIGAMRDLQICSHHIKELGTDWNQITHHHVRLQKIKGKVVLSCSWPNLPSHKERLDGHRKGAHLNREEARKYLIQSGIHLHVGLPVLGTIAEGDEERCDRTFVVEPELEDGGDVEMCPVETPEQSAFFAFTKAAGISRACPKKDFWEYTRDTQTRKVRVLQEVCMISAKNIAPNAFEELMRRAGFNRQQSWNDRIDEKTANVLSELSRHFMLADEVQTQDLILSIAAGSYSYQQLLPFFPALSLYKYTKARRLALSHEIPEKSEIKRDRWDAEMVEEFILFLTSPHMVMGLPSGMRYVKTSTGETMEIPDVIRNYGNAEIIRMFKAYMKEIAKSQLVLSDSTLIRILNALPATKRHNLTCVDSFKAAGYEAFELIKKLLDRLVELGLMTKDLAKDIWFDYLEIRLYLKSDFFRHVKNDSRVADHSLLFALSDPNNPKFAVQPSHDHNYQCSRCVHIEKTFRETFEYLSSLIPTYPEHEKELKEMVFNLGNHKETIAQLKAHELRSKYTDLQREVIIEGLPDRSAMITFDYAQKHITTGHIEDQKGYYGKAGMSWHVAHVLANISGRYVAHSFVHIDSQAVVSITEAILKELHGQGIHSVHIRSDNAAYYHCAPTLGSMPEMYHKTGVKVKSWSFSEAQNGKGSADRIAAQCKSKIRRYINSGGNVKNHTEMFLALDSFPHLTGISVYLVNITAPSTPPILGTIHRVTDYSHFEFGDRKVRVWKYFGIGEGVVFDKLKNANLGIYNEKKRGGRFGSPETAATDRQMIKAKHRAMFWHYNHHLIGKEESGHQNIHIEDEVGSESSVEMKGLVFGCWCGARYIRYGNLLAHLEHGKHLILPLKITAIDYSRGYYKSCLEDQILSKSLQPLQDAMEKKIVMDYFLEKRKADKRAEPGEAFQMIIADPTIPIEERMSMEQVKRLIRRLLLVPIKRAMVIRARRGSDVEMEDVTVDWTVEEVEEGEWAEITDCGGEDGEQIEDDVIYNSFHKKNRNDFFTK